MVETAIYVLLGALTAALLALMALPAISRRAFRLAQERARLSAPLSAAEAQADRDALRGRHAVEIALAERRANTAQDQWAQAQIALGERTAEIARRDSEIKEKAQELASQREELARLAREVSARDEVIAARDEALRDFETQRDAAVTSRAQATTELTQALQEVELARLHLEERVEDLSRELRMAEHGSDSALFAAKTTIGDLERRLEEAEADASRLQRQVRDLLERLIERPATPGAYKEGVGHEEFFQRRRENALQAPEATAPLHDRLAEAAARENELSARVAALGADLAEAERDCELWRARAAASETRAERLSEADDSLRQTIARLGRDLVASRAAQALVDSQREPAS